MFNRPRVHLPKLVHLCKLWIKHNLDALCLCELGDHLNGLPGYELTLEATIRQFMDNECRQGGVLEPDLCFIWGNGKSSAQLADTRSSDERMGSSYLYILDCKRLEVLRDPKVILREHKVSFFLIQVQNHYKMKMRHQGFSLSLHFGANKLFMTSNFADTYSPIVLKLFTSAVEDQDLNIQSTRHEAVDDTWNLVGSQRVDLFEDAPSMPTLQQMHRIVSKHPAIQARLFLLMEQLTITELLCCSKVGIGRHGMGSLDPQMSPVQFEDDYISNGSPGLANFATSLLAPLEAQGRGFSHDHKKVMGVPNSRAAAVKAMSSIRR